MRKESTGYGTAIGHALRVSGRIFSREYKENEHNVTSKDYPGMQRHVFLFSDGSLLYCFQPSTKGDIDMIIWYGCL